MTLRRAPEEGHAYFACASCSKLKRKCSRELPACQLCVRVGRQCEYQDPSLRTSASEISSPRTHGRSASRTATPSSLHFVYDATPRPGPSLARWFIDSVAARGSASPRPEFVPWSYVSNFPAPSPDSVRLISGRYFASVHHWLPIVSRKRLSRHLQGQEDLASADLVVLLLTMNLLSQRLPEQHAGHQYHSVRSALSACESMNMLTTNLLAANILLAMYEVAEAIYPSAYISVSRCTRMLYAFGLHDKKKAIPLYHVTGTWTENEERRRLWWAAILLDRQVHAGFRFRPLCVQNIPPGEILPAHDDKWDEGELTVNALLVMSVEAKTEVSPFARTCQAAHILGRVCEHVNEHASAEDIDIHLEEANQILRAIKALKALVDDEVSVSPKPYCLFTAKALCISALSLMYDTHGCIEDGQLDSSGVNRGLRLDLQQQAIDGCKTVAEELLQFANDLRGVQIELVSPFVLHSIYSAAGTWAWLHREGGDARSLGALEQLRYVLGWFGDRWRVAKEYLSLLEGTEHTYTGGYAQ